MLDRLKLKKFLHAQVGKPYGHAECGPTETPRELDCSEYVERAFAEVGVAVPDGCVNQFPASRPLDLGEARLVGDVNFFKKKDAPPHHVVMWFDEKNVIEARGEPFNAVILRPLAKIEAWPESTGWRRFLAVDKADGRRVAA